MEIYWQGKDVTDFVQVRKCVVRDTCGGRCDSLELEFENAAGWSKWGPEEDDKIIVSQNGYDTGTMYLNTVLPEDGIYRILATALPCVTRKKEYKSFIGKTIEEIMRACGMVTGMGFAVYGIDQKTVIPYIQQENESAAAFLCRLRTASMLLSASATPRIAPPIRQSKSTPNSREWNTGAAARSIRA